jgi:uncharacterized membrane protein (UPF0182 family)
MLQATRPEPVATPGDARPGPLWRTPRARSLLELGVLAVLAWLVSLLAQAYTDLLWFRELGHARVFWATLKWKLLGGALPAFGTASFLLVNCAFVERVVAAHTPLRPYRTIAYPAAAVVAGLITLQWRAAGTWKLLALWAGRSDFGTRDPLLHRDVGFYAFRCRCRSTSTGGCWRRSPSEWRPPCSPTSPPAGCASRVPTC